LLALVLVSFSQLTPALHVQSQSQGQTAIPNNKLNNTQRGLLADGKTRQQEPRNGSGDTSFIITYIVSPEYLHGWRSGDSPNIIPKSLG
jgi:hypothetical protein